MCLWQAAAFVKTMIIPECIVQRLGAELLSVCDRNRGSRLNFSASYSDYGRQLCPLIFGINGPRQVVAAAGIAHTLSRGP